MIDLRKIVIEKIAASSDVIKQAVKKSSRDSNPSIRNFFPELDGQFEKITNIPSGISPPQFALLGQKGVFDLRPLSPQEFLKLHRIDIHTAEALVERGVLIPNLYARSPQAWHGFGHLYPLLKTSIVNGERSDAFLRRIYPLYDEKRDHRRNRLTVAFSDLTPEQRQSLAEVSRALPVDRLEHISGTRWAYLDALNPNLSYIASELLEKHQLKEFVSFLRVAKHICASPMTASAGGRFVWGPEDIALRRELGVAHSPTEMLSITQELEYLLSEISGIRPFDNFNFYDSGKLLEFIDRSDNIAMRDAILKMTDDLVELAAANKISEAKVADYKKMIEDYRSRLTWFRRFTQHGLGAANAIAFGVTLSGVGGAILGYSLGAIIATKQTGIARALYRACNRTADRVITTIDGSVGRS